jgi:hypothetical protein
MGDTLYIICPWHHFDFSLDTGLSSTGLKQEVYKTRVENGILYINSSLELSLNKPKYGICEANNNPKNDLLKSIYFDRLSLNDDAVKIESENTLSYWAVKILNTPDPNDKCDLTDKVAQMWFNNEILSEKEDFFVGSCEPPSQPKRLESLNIIDPAKIRRGKGGTQVLNIFYYIIYFTFNLNLNLNIRQAESLYCIHWLILNNGRLIYHGTL